jgi:hypothetical protein
MPPEAPKRRGDGDDLDLGRPGADDSEIRLSTVEIKVSQMEGELRRIIERIDRVFDLLIDMKSEISTLRSEIALISGKISDAPTKQFIFTTILSIIGFAFVVGGAVATAYHYLR